LSYPPNSEFLYLSESIRVSTAFARAIGLVSNLLVRMFLDEHC
jgi:hypothetical protein